MSNLTIQQKLRAMGGYFDNETETQISCKYVADYIDTLQAEIYALRAKVASADVLVEAFRKEQSSMIRLAAEMAMKKNMPDVEQVEFSVNIPKKSWRSIMRMCANSTQQCNDWSYKLRGNADRLSALATYDKLREGSDDL